MNENHRTIRNWMAALGPTLLLLGLQAAASPAAESPSEEVSIATLQSAASPAEKSQACLHLRLLGTARAVPALGAALRDEEVSHAARYALDGLNLPEAAAELRSALGATSGLTRLGIIHSLGARRDREAVPLLASLLTKADDPTVAGIAIALGEIGGPESVAALLAARPTVAPSVSPLVSEGLFRCAEQMVSQGQRAEALSIYETILGRAETVREREAAFAGVLRTDESRSVERIVRALEETDPLPARVALSMAVEVNHPAFADHLIKLLPELAPERQVGLLHLLGAREELTARAAVERAAASADVAVRAAAFTTLGVIGDASSAPLLAEAAVSTEKVERAAARQALVSLRRGPVPEALLALLDTAEPPVQTEIALILRARAETSVTPQLLQLARSDRPSTRVAALRAVGGLAESQDFPQLLEVLLDLPDEESRAVLRSGVEALVKRSRKATPLDAAPLVRKLSAATVPQQLVLLPVCVWFADERVRGFLRASIAEDNAAVRDAALRTLCASEDASLLPDIVEQAGRSSNPEVRSLALEACVRLVVEHGASLPGSSRADTLVTAYPLATKATDKWRVLGGATRVPDKATLHLAERALEDGGVRAEAETAVMQIALKLGANEPTDVRRAIARLAAQAVDERIKAEARAWLGDGSPGPRYIFDLPAGTAGEAFERVVKTTGCRLEFVPKEVNWLTTPAVQGDLTVPEVLGRLLADTPMEAVADPASGAIKIIRRAPPLSPPAT